jgi:hypothetical protein
VSNATDSTFRLRLSKGCLKTKVSQEAGDMLRRILEIESSSLKTDILRSLIADSLNQFHQEGVPAFSHFMIQNALGDVPVRSFVGQCKHSGGEGEGKKFKQGGKKGQVTPSGKGFEGEGSPPEAGHVSPDTEGAGMPEEGAAANGQSDSEDFDINPRFQHLIG